MFIASGEPIRISTAMTYLAPCLSKELVSAGISEDHIVPIPTADDVVTSKAMDNIIATEPHNHIILLSAGQDKGIVLGSANNRCHLVITCWCKLHSQYRTIRDWRLFGIKTLRRLSTPFPALQQPAKIGVWLVEPRLDIHHHLGGAPGIQILVIDHCTGACGRNKVTLMGVAQKLLGKNVCSQVASLVVADVPAPSGSGAFEIPSPQSASNLWSRRAGS